MTPRDDLYLDAGQACDMLGINVATLYAYVSRKRVRSEPVEGSRSRRYWKADIERLAGKTPQAPAARPQTPLVSVSRITLMTDAGLYFRGRDAIEMSRTSTLESMAAFLWQADEKQAFGAAPVGASKLWQQLRPSLRDLSVQERAIAMFPMIERADARAYDLSPAGFARTGADVLRWYATLLVQAPRPTAQPLHQFVARALKAPEALDEVIRQLLVLAADHEFDPITYAVRAVANVGVTPYQAVAAGLIASQGQRFQAERYGATMRFLDEILDASDGHAAVVKRLRNGEAIPGFGDSSRGSVPDPRATAIMQTLDRTLRGDPELRRLHEADRAAHDATGSHMNFIVPALFIGRRVGLRGSELALSGLGRLTGWIAHAMEQFHDNPLIRPRARYEGQLPQGSRVGDD